MRDLTDEEAFRLADIENRDRDDISDYERARDYAQAIELYYGGKQKAMATRLEVSEAWLSRYLNLARLPSEVVQAFPSIRDIKELHARTLKPLLADAKGQKAVLAEAARIGAEQRAGQGCVIEPPQVIARLKAAGAAPKPSAKRKADKVTRYRNSADGLGIVARRSGRKTVLEVPDAMTKAGVEAALALFLRDRFGNS